MTALALTIRPTRGGWGVYLTNGRELIRYRGIGSRSRALRYAARVPAEGSHRAR
jgi:hypothetical protein